MNTFPVDVFYIVTTRLGDGRVFHDGPYEYEYEATRDAEDLRKNWSGKIDVVRCLLKPVAWKEIP